MRAVNLRIAVAVDDRDDRPRRYNLLGDGNTARNQSARILSQIDDERGHARLTETRHLCSKLIARVLGK